MTFLKCTAGALVEIGTVPEIFATTIAAIEQAGSCHRLIFASAVVPLDCEDCPPEEVVKVRVVLTPEALRALLNSIPAYLERVNGLGEHAKPWPVQPAGDATAH